MSGYLENLFNGDDENSTPLTAAIGFNDGANKGFWRVQPRQKLGKERGRWIEMGAELRAYFKDLFGNFGSVPGRALGSDGTPDGVRVLVQGQEALGLPDGIYRFSTKDVRVAEALISDDYLESKGIDDSTIPSDIDVASLTSIADIERADITPDDIRLANDGINSAEGKQLSAFKESDEGKAIAQLEDAVVDNAAVDDMISLRDKLSDKEELKPNIDADERMKEFFGDVVATPYPDDTVNGKSEGMEYTDPRYDDNVPSYGVEKNNKTGLYEAVNYRTGEIFYGANKNEALNQVLDRFDPEVDARNKARREARKKLDDAEFARENDSPALSRDDFGKKVDDMVSGYYDDLTGNKLPGTPDVPTKEQIDRAYDNYSRDYNIQKNEESLVDSDSNDFFVEDALDGLREETDTVGSFEREMAEEQKLANQPVMDEDAMEEAANAARASWKDRFPALQSGDVDTLSSPESLDAMKTILNEGAAKNPDFYKPALDAIDDPNTSGAEKLQNVADVLTTRGTNADGSPMGFTDGNDNRETLLSARQTLEGALFKAGIKTSADDVYQRKADRLIQDAMAGKDTPDAGSIIESLGGAKKTKKKKEPTEEDLVDEPIIDPLDDLIGTDVETSDFDRPIISKDRLSTSEIEPGDFVTNPETGDPMRVDDIEFDANGSARVTGEDRDGISREFFGGPNQVLSKINYGEPGNTPVVDEPAATPARKTPAPADIVPKESTVPKNAKKATNENIAVGDKVWDKDGVEIGTVRKITGKGFTNFGDAYTEAEVIDSNGKISRKRFREDQKYSKVSAPAASKPAEKPVAPTEPAPIPEPVIVPTPEPEAPAAPPTPPNGPEDGAEGGSPDGPDGPDVPEIPDVPEDVVPPVDEPEEPEEPEVERRGDHGRDILPTTKTVQEMRETKITKKNGTQDPDAILSQLAEDYPDGFFVDNPEDALDGGFMTHRQTIDGGKTRMEIVVMRTNGNQFQVATRFTDLATGEESTFVHQKPRDSYTGIHGVDNGVEILSEYLSGRKMPVAPGSAQARSFFAPGNTWNNRMGYWRNKYNKSNRTEDQLTDAQLEVLEDKFDGDIDAMNAADTINAMRMRTLEEVFQHAANGQAEVLNETTAEYLGNKMKSEVVSFYKALKDGDVETARVRFQAMMNTLPDNNVAGNVFLKVIRKGLKDQLDRSGVQGDERTRALQSLSATVTNYTNHANKSWTLDNTVKLAHVSGGGLTVVKKGDKVEFTDNMGRKVVGRVVGLRANSGPNGNNDFARLQFLGEDGKLHTSDADLAATHMKLVDPNTPLTSYDGWDRLGDLTFSRLGQEATDRRKAARLKKAMSWKDPSDPNYNPNKVDLAYLGSDGLPEGEEPSGDEGGIGKAATELLPGDEIFSPSGEMLGTVVKTKITTVNGEPVVAVQYRDADGNLQKVAYGPDEEIGPSSPKD